MTIKTAVLVLCGWLGLAGLTQAQWRYPFVSPFGAERRLLRAENRLIGAEFNFNRRFPWWYYRRPFVDPFAFQSPRFVYIGGQLYYWSPTTGLIPVGGGFPTY